MRTDLSNIPLQEAIHVAVRVASGEQSPITDANLDRKQHEAIGKSVAALVTSTALLLRTVRVLADKELENYLSVGFEGLLLTALYLQSRVGPYQDTAEGTRELLSLLADFGAKGPKAARAMASFVSSTKVTPPRDTEN